MAEALAVVGVVASIIQLVDFSSKILHRLEEFHSNAGEVPKSFRHIKAELAVLGDTLRQTKKAIDAGSVEVRTKRALLPAIKGCWEQIAQLDAILAKTLPEANDSWGERSRKAIVSLHQDAKAESIAKILRNYISILTFYYAAGSSTLQPLTGRYAMNSSHNLTANLSVLRCKTRQDTRVAICARPIHELPKSVQTTSC